MKRSLLLPLALLAAGAVSATDPPPPASGPKRLAWMRRRLRNTVSKFEFTHGYQFRKRPENLGPFMAAIKGRGFSAWDQMPHPGGIWNDEQLASLERSLEAAAEAGLNVWATLCPPSGREEIARWPKAQRREYYWRTAERFAHLAVKHPHFVAFTCDDMGYNWRFFTPEMLAEMAGRWRAVCPRLAFVPLVYGVNEELFKSRGDYLDGVVYHFRAGSYPHSYIPAYDPKNFDMYGDVMRYELKRARRIAGDHPLICGIYVWYYGGGWGVLTPDEKNPSNEHIVRDATQKLTIAHDYSDGVRVYGLGIDHDAYKAMSKLLHNWQQAGASWGSQRGDPESHLERWQRDLGQGPFLGTLLEFERGLGRDLHKLSPWPRVELLRWFERGEFDPAAAARMHPLLLVSRANMPREWPVLLAEYARSGGTLALEYVPGWTLDTTKSPLREGEMKTGEGSPATLAFGELCGVRFLYERRGFATRWRVVKDHPLTRGLGDVGVWRDVPYKEGGNTYGYLVFPVRPTDAEVLIEVEHEACRYDGYAYARKGKITGTHPLLTVKQAGRIKEVSGGVPIKKRT